MANPTWYDILGVAPDATPDEIKAAWRAATDKFEPGSGTSQFRLFNEAADVLLNPESRAAYDAGLAPDVEQTPDVEPPALEIETPEDEPAADGEPAPEPTADIEPAVDEPASATPTEQRALAPRAILERLGTAPLWAVGVLGVLAAAAVVMTVVLIVGTDTPVGDVEGITDRVAVADAGPDASAAAERALKAVLSYDYRHMEADRDRAAQFLAPAYRKDYLKTFNGLLEEGPDGSPGPAVKTKTVVTADVLDAGVVDAERDRVRVVAFVNQSSVKGSAEPTIFQNRVVATMVRDGDTWLIENIKSY
jgi:Mce-associated membrane protein